VEDAAKVVDAAKKKGLKVMYAENMLFSPPALQSQADNRWDFHISLIRRVYALIFKSERC